MLYCKLLYEKKIWEKDTVKEGKDSILQRKASGDLIPVIVRRTMEILEQEALLESMIRLHHIGEYFSDLAVYRPGFKLISFGRNTYLYSRPEHRKYAYFLVEGRLSVYATAENGEQMLVRCCDSFIFLGDMELLGYQEPSNMIRTDTRCLFVALDIPLLKGRLMEDNRFLRFLSDCLAEKINYLARHQFHNKIITARQKVIAHVLEVGGEKGYFKENLRKTAEILDLSYRHLHRILGELVEDGALERSSRGYELRRIKRLEELYWEYEKSDKNI